MICNYPGRLRVRYSGPEGVSLPSAIAPAWPYCGPWPGPASRPVPGLTFCVDLWSRRRPADPRSAVARERHRGPSPGLKLVLIILLFWGLEAPIWADSFRCGKSVLSIGDTLQELRQDCGEPLRRDFVREAFWLAEGLKKVRLEQWYYKPDSHKLERIVLIYHGEIVAIRTGAR